MAAKPPGGLRRKRSADSSGAPRLASPCPQQLPACAHASLLLPPPPGVPAPAPGDIQRCDGRHDRRAGGGRRWGGSDRGSRAFLLLMGGLVSTLVAGCAWPPAAGSARGPRIRFDERSAGWRRRGGGCVTRSRVAGAGISTASRSPRPGSRSRSRPKRARSTHATWPTPARRPRGFAGIGGAGAVEERSRCCAWCAPAGSSTSRTRFSWCRWTAWRRRSEPAREPHPAPGSWPRRRLRAERELLRGSLVARSGAGGGIGEHADEQEVREAVGDRLGHGGCVAVQGADRERGEPAGLLGVLDQRRRIGCRRGVLEPVGGLLVGERQPLVGVVAAGFSRRIGGRGGSGEGCRWRWCRSSRSAPRRRRRRRACWLGGGAGRWRRRRG